MKSLLFFATVVGIGYLVIKKTSAPAAQSASTVPVADQNSFLAMIQARVSTMASINNN